MRKSLGGRTQGEIVDRWPFADKPNTASMPILLVTHDADDGSWQFFCGTTNDSVDARVVGLGRMYQRDGTLGELADMPEGWCASRASPDHPWQRRPA